MTPRLDKYIGLQVSILVFETISCIHFSAFFFFLVEEGMSLTIVIGKRKFQEFEIIPKA